MAKKKTGKASTGAKKTRKTKPVRLSKPLKKQAKSKKTAVKKAITKKVQTKTKVAAEKKKPGKLTPRDKKLQEIKKNLIGQKEALLAEAEEALNALPGQTVFPDMGDQATAETDRNFMLRLRSREQKLLKKIEDAIERIDGGTFGICDDCGENIDIRRLVARPVTTLCIECKTQQEEEEKLREA
ncbi:MAG: DnaK suppressor protein [Nitrospirae bacterium]|nr:MAG: DnaK suppressor protein [Nitrospirota bacterium]